MPWSHKQPDLKNNPLYLEPRVGAVESQMAQKVKYEELVNAPTPVEISTYDGARQPTHPSVLYISSGFAGYKYWMAFTPFTNGDAATENPSLRCSNDGINWRLIDSFQPDPIVAAPASAGASNYNSDPNIVIYNGTMYMFYRTTIGGVAGTVTTYYITSTDGKTWTSKVATNLPSSGSFATSPSFMFRDGKWHCWFMLYPNYTTKHYTSTDLVNWVEDGVCTLNVAGYTLWHLEVFNFDGTYEVLATMFPNGLNENSSELFHGTSADGLTWNMKQTPIIKPSPIGWDSKSIYKSTMIKDSNGYRVWYSARNPYLVNAIGYAEGKTIETLRGKVLSGKSESDGMNLSGNITFDNNRGIINKGALAIKSTTTVAVNYGQGTNTIFYNGGTTPKITLDTNGKVLATGGIGVGNSVAATTTGSVVKKIQVFDANGNSLGYIPVYDTIS